MTKADLVAVASLEGRMSKKHAEAFIEHLFAKISEAVIRTGRFAYPGFGVWTLRTRKARKIRNPQNNDIMQLKASKTIGFRPAKELKAKLG
jgi:DNA-binding protein HU-beta